MRPKDVMDIDGEDLNEGDKVVVEEDPDNPGDQEGFKDYLITTDKVEPYMEVDSTRFHKSNSDYRIQLQCLQSSKGQTKLLLFLLLLIE